MRVFLTGATGFIGSHVARVLLQEGHEVSALIRPGADLRRISDVRVRLEILSGSLESLESAAAALGNSPPDVAIHLAWYAVPGKYLNSEANIECLASSLRLLEVLDEVGCPRTIIAGTCFEYDPVGGYLSEDARISPTSLYAAAKHALFLTASQYQRLKGREFAWARFFYQYGPWEDERRLVPLVIRSLMAGEPARLTPGLQIRDYLHVADVARAVVALAQSSLCGPVNIGSSQPVSIASLAGTIGELLGRQDLIELGALPAPAGDAPLICADTRRLRVHTGWVPQFTLRDGLLDTTDWWRKENHDTVL